MKSKNSIKYTYYKSKPIETPVAKQIDANIFLTKNVGVPFDFLGLYLSIS